MVFTEDEYDGCDVLMGLVFDEGLHTYRVRQLLRCRRI